MSKEDTQPRRRAKDARLKVARYAAVMLIAAIIIIVISHFSGARTQASSAELPVIEEFCAIVPFEEGEEA
ncbi:MAG: hypothetical protein FWC96_03035 [Oscillospiraceae bacterium]|nr:hypothetical protein [Oscillospiraceae bacterium]